MAIRTEKTRLRAEMKEIRAEAAARDPDASENLADAFPMKLLGRFGPIVSGYLPIGFEMDPGPLMRRLQSNGAQLSLPRVELDGTMTFRSWAWDDPLVEGPFGLRQPQHDAEPVLPTLLLLPLLAFDLMGNRLGYGQGHYDRAIETLRSKSRAFSCAVAYQAQLVEELPNEPHDQPLDWAITENGSTPLFMLRGFKKPEPSAEPPDAA